MIRKNLLLILLIGWTGFFYSCGSDSHEGFWDYELYTDEDDANYGTLKLEDNGGSYTGSLVSFEMGTMPLKNIEIKENKLTSQVELFGNTFDFEGVFPVIV